MPILFAIRIDNPKCTGPFYLNRDSDLGIGPDCVGVELAKTFRAPEKAQEWVDGLLPGVVDRLKGMALSVVPVSVAIGEPTCSLSLPTPKPPAKDEPRPRRWGKAS